MTSRRTRAFIDALAEGRRPPRARATTDEVEDIRTAIDLSVARPGEGTPDPGFVEELFAELRQLQAPQSSEAQAPATVVPLRRRRNNIILSLAAAAALVGGTVAVTESVGHGAGRPAARALPGHAVLTGSFETADHQQLGHITVFGGSPSWVFMNVAGSRYDGLVRCLLQSDSGSVVATGTFTVEGGSGEWARSLPGGVSNLRGAKLETATGVTLAAASFSNPSATAH
jgi:hypothetical protein